MPSDQQAISMIALFETFTRERRYLHNVSPKTLDWYKYSLKAFEPYLASVRSEADVAVEVRKAVMELTAAGKLKTTSINDYARCMNAFLKWLHTEQHITKLVRIPKLKATKKVLEILTDEQVKKIVTYKPKKAIERRVHVMILLILDTGLRINEVLNLRKEDVDLDNMLIKVQKGKGDKQRIVPFSMALRRILFKHINTHSNSRSEFVFSTASGSRQAYRNATNFLKTIGTRVGKPNLRFHLLRHTFATAYIRSGGNVALLRKILGHSSIATTMIYEHLQTNDLSAVHNRHSVLAAHA